MAREDLEGIWSARAATRVRVPPTPGGLARRRIVITLTKWLLPAGALLLLASIALWPEFDRAKDRRAWRSSAWQEKSAAYACPMPATMAWTTMAGPTP